MRGLDPQIYGFLGFRAQGFLVFREPSALNPKPLWSVDSGYVGYMRGLNLSPKPKLLLKLDEVSDAAVFWGMFGV